ncbi:hypothetical protein G5714_003094 [Onychostoma macrolepis]|uniref:Uncharacterized protein n=1 Tax=Onychostoma macrolepis TaxID=369639 RepID=A0A7J6D988_9TELE|nr:hypothetical protein G5714_003094 [Onychostoma macrolepis]
MEVKEKAEEQPQTLNVSLSRLETRSVISASSKSSRSSTASMAATRARAKAEAMRARTTFVEREAEVLLEKAKLESELLSLQHKKEVAATAKEAEILEAEIESGEIDMAIDATANPPETAEKRTKDYVDSLSGSSFHCLPPVKAELDSRDHEQFMTTPALPTMTATSHVPQDAGRLTRMSTSKPYQVSQPRMPSRQLSFPQHTPVNLPYISFSRNQGYGQVPVSEKSNKPQTPYLSSTTQQPSSSDHIDFDDNSLSRRFNPGEPGGMFECLWRPLRRVWRLLRCREPEIKLSVEETSPHYLNHSSVRPW